jgi:UDP-N-acetylmuramoylalanine--D-glutamate ligase
VRFSDLAGRRVAVWGLGLEGSAVVRHLRALEISPVIALPEAATAPEAEPEAVIGAAALAALEASDVVVKSPGIPVAADLYRHLASVGVAFTSATDLWLSDNAGRAIGVTGTKGKSTTASAIAHVLNESGHPCVVAGNIGASLLDAPTDRGVVAEVSSYQAQSISVSPRVAVVTSLFPEHLPWHGSESAYYDDKLRLVSQGARHVVAPGADTSLVARIRSVLPDGAELHLTGPSTVYADAAGLHWPGVGSIPSAELPLLGVHNAGNLALALLAASVADPSLPPADLLAAIPTFIALDHRMTTVPSRDGRRWIDDSLATAPEAVVAALSVFPDQPVALILGGSDRGLDMTSLASYLQTRPAPVHLLLIGAAGARFGDEHTEDLGHPAALFGSMAAAVAWGLSAGNPASVVLLSPGAPSFDEYANYADRARHLRELIAP